MIPFKRRLFTLNVLTASGIGRRFPYRVAEWQLAGAMMLCGIILMHPAATFSLPPYAIMERIATEPVWAAFFLLVGLTRLAVLAVNGSMARGSAFGRATMAFGCAWIWGLLIVGHLVMETPTLMLGMLWGAFVTEFVCVFRASGDARVAVNNGGGRNGHSD